MKTLKTKQSQAARGRRYLPGAGIALALVALIGCEGANMFSAENPAARPSASIVLPIRVFSGDTFSIRLEARAPRGLESINVSIRGAFFSDTLLSDVSGSASVSKTLRYRAPDFFVNDLIVVQASILDKVGVTQLIADTTFAVERQ